MTKGMLISIDGIDGVGKNTQSIILRDKIREVRGDCGFFSFPRYNTPTGKLVGEYLNSGRDDLTLTERARLYSNDRLAAKEEMLSYLERGIDVVCDRYVDSNLAFFSSFAKMAVNAQPGDDKKMVDSIEQLEYEEMGLPVADLTFILLLSTELATQMVETKKERDYTKEKLDAHERNKELLVNSLAYYQTLDKKADRYKLINCSADNQTVMSVTSISGILFTAYLSQCNGKT